MLPESYSKTLEGSCHEELGLQTSRNSVVDDRANFLKTKLLGGNSIIQPADNFRALLRHMHSQEIWRQHYLSSIGAIEDAN